MQTLVTGKNAWKIPLSPEAVQNGILGWHQRGYLPHCDLPAVTQMLTLRLADSLPAARRGEWEHLLKIEDDRERRRRLEMFLDLGCGACWLRQPEIAALTEGALRFFDGQRYRLAAWVVMPNHLHVLLDVGDIPLSKVVKTWKDYVAREANRRLGRTGSFWEREYLDTVVRGEPHRRRAIRYIESNPVKAGLTCEARQWPWSSARWRDEFGRLTDTPVVAGQQPPPGTTTGSCDPNEV